MRLTKKLEQLYTFINEEWEVCVTKGAHHCNNNVIKAVLLHFKNNSEARKYGWRMCKKDGSEFYRLDICAMHAYLYEYDALNKNKASYYALSTIELAMRILQRQGKGDFGLRM